MTSVFQLFKIIFSLIAAGLILYFLIYYTGAYSDIQESSIKAKILDNFEIDVKNVYSTGIPVSFTDFSRADFDLTFDLYEPEGIRFSQGKKEISTPLFFSPGEEVLIDRGYLDMEWWRFYFVTATPSMKVIFNPGDNSPGTWDLMMDTVSLFPSTQNSDIKITFGLCDGSAVSEDLCDGLCERSGFLGVLNTLKYEGTGFSRCTAPPGNYRFVTISSSCSRDYMDQGICITPPNSRGIGNAYVNSSPEDRIYKDPLDLMVMIVGGEKKDIFGSAADNLFVYKNRLFAERVGLACDVLSQRSRLITQNLPSSAESEVCEPAYLSFSQSLKSVSGILSEPDYYETYGNLVSLVDSLAKANSDHKDLISNGCEEP